MFENPCYFEPTFLNLGSQIFGGMTGLDFCYQRRKSEDQMRLPTWLRLGLKIAGYGILGQRFHSRLMIREAAVLAQIRNRGF